MKEISIERLLKENEYGVLNGEHGILLIASSLHQILNKQNQIIKWINEHKVPFRPNKEVMKKYRMEDNADSGSYEYGTTEK